MNSKKNNSTAIEYRLAGNAYYKSRKFYQALVCYNKSLCHAIPTSEEFALTFANRSAVYYEIEEYDICMENIQLAFDFKYPADKSHKLVERYERCMELIECYNNAKNDSEKFISNFFKLSYAPKKNIPLIADCIELKCSKKYGRHLITNTDLKAGDIIAIENPFYKFIFNNARFTHCTNCLRSVKLNLFPCCNSNCNNSKLRENLPL
jgi:tetratricopeptide (TPR) repeat protein